MFQERPPIPAVAIAEAAARPRRSRDRRVFFAGKRSFDVGMSVLFLPCLAVIALVLLVLNPVLNRGPLFYTQVRMGRDCQPFTAIKFRTMLPAEGATRGADDPLEQDRITPLGRFLRKSRVDELPQVINVVRGEMSLVGPRPLWTEEAKQCRGWTQKRLDITPGITGLWQVTGRSDIPFDEMVKLDYLYVTGWSLGWDLKLLLQTVPAVLGRRGAY